MSQMVVQATSNGGGPHFRLWLLIPTDTSLTIPKGSRRHGDDQGSQQMSIQQGREMRRNTQTLSTQVRGFANRCGSNPSPDTGIWAAGNHKNIAELTASRGAEDLVRGLRTVANCDVGNTSEI
jgi:hypothetical protein